MISTIIDIYLVNPSLSYIMKQSFSSHKFWVISQSRITLRTMAFVFFPCSLKKTRKSLNYFTAPLLCPSYYCGIHARDEHGNSFPKNMHFFLRMIGLIQGDWSVTCRPCFRIWGTFPKTLPNKFFGIPFKEGHFGDCSVYAQMCCISWHFSFSFWPLFLPKD